ncbi:MAG: hypothetical protein ABIP64_17045 [Burkholderiales bacterium]
MTKKILATLCAAPLALSAAAADVQGSADTALTIYSSAQAGSISPEQYRNGGQGQSIPGYALIRQERTMNLDKGRTLIRFTDVAAQIDPTTVSFTSLTDPEGTRVIEQNYQFDLVSTDKLLEKYIDNEITVEQQRGDKTETITGVLTSTAGHLILKSSDGSVRIVNGYAGVKLPKLPGGLITKPTLVWDVATTKPGAHRTRVAYQTTGITWWADYNFTYSEGKDANSCKLDTGAWVSILNQSGGSYQDAKLRLIAGDVQRGQPAPRMMMKGRVAEMAKADATPAFAEKTFFEYHLYTLGFPTTLPNNSTKQIELFPAARDVACEKTLLYYGQANPFYGYGSPMLDRNYGLESNKKVDVYLTFKNSKENNMGMPLPAGRIRVSKLDTADNSLEFVGEDRIDHTPKNEKARIKLGSAFDVIGERRQVDFRIDTNAKWMEEDIEIKLRNQKDEAVTVIARENLSRWNNWRILKGSQPHEKQDANTVHFPVKIAKGSEAVVRYTVRYTW